MYLPKVIETYSMAWFISYMCKQCYTWDVVICQFCGHTQVCLTPLCGGDNDILLIKIIKKSYLGMR